MEVSYWEPQAEKRKKALKLLREAGGRPLKRRAQPPTQEEVIRAAKEGDVTELAAFHEAGTDLLVAPVLGTSKQTAAYIAAESGHVEALRYLHDEVGVNLSVPDGHGSLPVEAAASEGHAEVLRYFDEVGVNLSVRDSFGITPASWAAMNGHAKALEVLREAGADLQSANEVEEEGDTPAHLAAVHGHVDALRVLIEAGVDVNAVNDQGKTPADLAMDRSHQKCLELLQQAGGRPLKHH
ncbi:CTTNBP2 [Symbiodinium sp. CCMP2592]|nr:CTTNBP2 [Symbiodinium sp. CCMP2592]